MDKLTVRDIDVNGKKVLVRVDFNVPLDYRTGEITDDSRIKATLPTIDYLIDNGARVILCSHLGRPKGKVIAELSLGIVARRLSQILRQPVMITDDCIGCTICAQKCPAEAIPAVPYQRHEIIQENCTKCDICRQVCPHDTVEIISAKKDKN